MGQDIVVYFSSNKKIIKKYIFILCQIHVMYRIAGGRPDRRV